MHRKRHLRVAYFSRFTYGPRRHTNKKIPHSVGDLILIENTPSSEASWKFNYDLGLINEGCLIVDQRRIWGTSGARYC
jgi:hypothetical protein